MPEATNDASRHTPTEVRAPRGARVVEIDFEDGHTGHYPHDVLRGFCPCATCQGHGGEIEYREGGNLDLVDVAEVGNYALRLAWADGHDTGIYSFTFLRALCTCDACLSGDGKARTFKR